MNLTTLLKQSLWHYRRTTLAVLLGTAVGTGVLTGALMIGDAVRHSLEQRVQDRLGKTAFAVTCGEAFTHASLANRLGQHLDIPAAATLQLPGLAVTPNGSARANRVHVYGIDHKFFAMAPMTTAPPDTPAPGDVALNRRLANQLGVSPGDTVIIRVDTPSRLNRNIPLANADTSVTALRLRVSHIHAPAALGHFSLRSEQALPMNAFVDREFLASKLEQPASANLILIGSTSANLTNALTSVWTPADLGLSIQPRSDGGCVLQSDRIFLNTALLDAAQAHTDKTDTLFTYFVNTLRTENQTTPYSFVAGLDTSPVPPNMADDELVATQWLADDLDLAINDEIQLAAFTLGPHNRLIETSRTFRVHRIVPLNAVAGDPAFTADFPGLSDAKNCRDWDPGIPIDLSRIRNRDEAYWKTYRTTPKAFVTLSAAQSMWQNRYGRATAVRYPEKDSSRSAEWLNSILTRLRPGDVGMRILPVRKSGLQASREGVSFGQLFIGLSFFIIAAALLLTGMLFSFSVQQRTAETGILLALGFRRHDILRLRLIESALIALPGAALGVGLGILYNHVILKLLSGAWQTIVGTVSLQLIVRPETGLIGFAGGALTAWLTLWIAAHRQLRRTPAILQRTCDLDTSPNPLPSTAPFIVGAVCWLAVITIITVAGNHPRHLTAVFFGAGTLALAGCFALEYGALLTLRRLTTDDAPGLGETAVRACGRHPRHSLAVTGVLAAGVFLVIATGANRPGPPGDPDNPRSGTGGFDLYAESAIPILDDPRLEQGRHALGIDDDGAVTFVPLRVFEGDDASCLNLNRVSTPPVLGVPPHALQGRFSFAAAAQTLPAESPWTGLNATASTLEIPAVADQSVILWGLGKSIGETLTFNDDRGYPLSLRLVGGTANSILQGYVAIAERQFLEHFPNHPGYRILLIDVHEGDPADVARRLTRTFADYGLQVTPTPVRLAAFASIQDTYLSIFMMLGALGLLLGSVGLGIVVARNVLERRGELAMLNALGFKSRAIYRLIFIEHIILFGDGLFSGTLSGLIAILPALRSQGTPVSPGSLVLLLSILFLNGLLWITAAITLSTRAPLLPALRQE